MTRAYLHDGPVGAAPDVPHRSELSVIEWAVHELVRVSGHVLACGRTGERRRDHCACCACLQRAKCTLSQLRTSCECDRVCAGWPVCSVRRGIIKAAHALVKDGGCWGCQARLCRKSCGAGTFYRTVRNSTAATHLNIAAAAAVVLVLALMLGLLLLALALL